MTRVSERSRYDMSQLWVAVQIMHRNPKVLPFGWRQFFYLFEEYVDSVDNPGTEMVWLLIEGARRFSKGVLRAAVDLVDPKTSTTQDDFRQLAWNITRQPVDHSAAYLSIACLNLVRHLSDEERASLIVECPVKFGELLESDADQDSRRWFSASMAFMYEEVRAVSNNFPMTKDAVLRLAAAITQLIGWDCKYPEIRIRRDRLRTFQPGYALWNVKAVTETFRPLTLAMTAPLDWMIRNHYKMDRNVEKCVRLHAKLAFCCASDPRAPLDLVAMSALLVLAEGLPEDPDTDYMTSLPCDPVDVLTVPGAYLLPTSSRNSQYGPPNVQPELDEFLKQLNQCTNGVEEEPNLLFREASRRLYRLTPFGVHQSRTYHTWVKSKVEPDRITTTGSSVKRKADDSRGGKSKRGKK